MTFDEREADRMWETIKDTASTANAAKSHIETHEEVCAERYRNIVQRLNWMVLALGVLMTVELGKGYWPELVKIFAVH